MGYRSDVKLILTNKGMKMLKEKVPQSLTEERAWEVDPIYEATKLQDKCWLVEWEDVKWYDDWEDYKVPCAVKRLLGELHEKDEPFQFIRIGEDYEDVERDVIYGKESMPYLELKREIEVEY